MNYNRTINNNNYTPNYNNNVGGNNQLSTTTTTTTTTYTQSEPQTRNYTQTSATGNQINNDLFLRNIEAITSNPQQEKDLEALSLEIAQAINADNSLLQYNMNSIFQAEEILVQKNKTTILLNLALRCPAGKISVQQLVISNILTPREKTALLFLQNVSYNVFEIKEKDGSNLRISPQILNIIENTFMDCIISGNIPTNKFIENYIKLVNLINKSLSKSIPDSTLYTLNFLFLTITNENTKKCIQETIEDIRNVSGALKLDQSFINYKDKNCLNQLKERITTLRETSLSAQTFQPKKP